MTAAVTLPPANAALVAAGVQTIVTLPTKPKALTAGDRLVIHAGTKLPKGGQHIGEFIVDDDGEGPYLVRRVGRYSGEPLLMFMHPGHIVASARVCDVVPIVLYPDSVGDAACIENSDMLVHWKAGENDEYADTLIDDQLPLADFTPGRWAVLLDDVMPTTDRCPACWGRKVRAVSGDEWLLPGCDVCGATGTCPPIPWKGKPGVWEVTW